MESLNQLDQKTINKKMSICIKQFKLILLKSEEDIAIRKSQLRNIHDRERLTLLQNKLKVKST